jgi:hypothetical protein
MIRRQRIPKQPGGTLYGCEALTAGMIGQLPTIELKQSTAHLDSPSAASDHACAKHLSSMIPGDRPAPPVSAELFI